MNNMRVVPPLLSNAGLYKVIIVYCKQFINAFTSMGAESQKVRGF